MPECCFAELSVIVAIEFSLSSFGEETNYQGAFAVTHLTMSIKFGQRSSYIN